MSLLELRDLSLAIHGAGVLGPVSFELEAGEVMGLVGASGSGKSLTALSIIRLLPQGSAVSGTVRLGGQDLLGLGEKALCRIRGAEIGMIFQEPHSALNPLHCIGDQVAEVLVIHGRASRARARELARAVLARVGLPDDRFPMTLYPHELSGGQRQRVAIAMAVALRPRLLIADEPTTALDVTSQAQILELLKSLVRDDGMALLLITHDLAVVAGIADHVAVLHRGRVVEAGRTEALFRGRAHEHTRALIAATHLPARAAPRQAVSPAAPLLTVEDARRDYLLARPTPFAPYPRLAAVDGVSFTLHRGESLGLVGESGCGKSTLARAILGLDRLQSGSIRLNGKPVHPHMPKPERASMQAVFQDPYGSFDPRWRVERLVAEPFHLTGRPDDWRARVGGALQEVGLAATDATKYVHEFSGGQRQRIAIARALITRPELIVLDEAVSALDTSLRAQILELLAALQQSHGLSYLFISHDLAVVRAVTDRVLVMRAGRIVEAGPSREVFSRPDHDYTRGLIAALPAIPPDWLGAA